MVREHLSRVANYATSARKIGAFDVGAMVEPILADLGWDVLDPLQVHRTATGGESLHLALSIGGRPRVALGILPLDDNPSFEAAVAAASGLKPDWIASTNGLTWRIWRRGAAGAPFREISIDTADAGEALAAVLSVQAHAVRAIEQLWADEAIGTALVSALKHHLSGSNEIVALLGKDLKAAGVIADAGTIRETLLRTDIRFEPVHRSVAETKVEATAPVEIQTEAPSAAPAAGTETAAPARPAARPRPKAKKKAPGKAVAKTSRKTPAKAESTPAAAPATAEAGTPASTKTRKRTVAKQATPTEAAVAVTPDVDAVEPSGSDAAVAAAPETESPAAAPKGASLGKNRAFLTQPTEEKVQLGPDDVNWPKDATHFMHRSGHTSFISYNPETHETHVLPGTIMRVKFSKSMPKFHAKLRERALIDGQIVQDGAMLRVVRPIKLDTPSGAASFVGGSVSNGWTSWRDRDDVLIVRPPVRQRDTIHLNLGDGNAKTAAAAAEAPAETAGRAEVDAPSAPTTPEAAALGAAAAATAESQAAEPPSAEASGSEKPVSKRRAILSKYMKHDQDGSKGGAASSEAVPAGTQNRSAA